MENRTCFESKFQADGQGSRRAKALVQSTCYLFFVPSLLTCAPVPCFPLATRLPLSLSDFSPHCFADCPVVFPLRAQTRASSLVQRRFKNFLSLPVLITPFLGVADAQQRWHGGLSVCSVPATDPHLDRQLNTSQLSLPVCEFWQSGASCNDSHWIEPQWLNVSVPPSSESRNTFSRYR